MAVRDFDVVLLAAGLTDREPVALRDRVLLLDGHTKIARSVGLALRVAYGSGGVLLGVHVGSPE